EGDDPVRPDHAACDVPARRQVRELLVGQRGQADRAVRPVGRQGGLNSPAPVALRSTPLRVMVRRAERGRRLLAGALIAPSLVFVLAAFAAPIALFLFRSVANPEVPGTLRRTLARLREWDGRDLPDERAYAALAADLKAVADSPDVAVLARRLNYNVPGFRTLVIRTA